MGKNGKSLVVVTLTPPCGMALDASVSKETLKKRGFFNIVNVFPHSPVTKRMLMLFLRSNNALRKLVDHHTWGRIDELDYKKLNDEYHQALNILTELTDKAEKALKTAEDKKRKRTADAK